MHPPLPWRARCQAALDPPDSGIALIRAGPPRVRTYMGWRLRAGVLCNGAARRHIGQ